jgi:RNA polymerase sigma-70 factor (ECF subfamily)
MVKERVIAEDIFQEVFIKIIDTLRGGTYAEEGKFLPWALRIAHNLSVDYFRKSKRNPVVFNKSDEHDMFDSMDLLEEGAEGKIIRSQGHELVRQLLDTLPQEQREVIVLRHFANLSFKEIAEKTNCSINTALGRMRYGLINLRKLIEEYQVAV